ncbi:hypothetical protein B0T22DRAFT_11249 [Podospora appendiculata]|uniref:LPXTG-motif cell wall anchor domain protein n=1 Tax=Podospora appendiculata TaxID=314037 RepID=A0AAE0XF89_9PEZI|nr:hypothetical protein B0T22DRAFT_11249 [Podospora appendiculata]
MMEIMTSTTFSPEPGHGGGGQSFSVSSSSSSTPRAHLQPHSGSHSHLRNAASLSNNSIASGGSGSGRSSISISDSRGSTGKYLHENANSRPAATSSTCNNDRPGDENNSVISHAVHRQNHNSSKLPAFRFADLKKDALVLPSLQRIPPSPSPAQTTQQTQTQTRTQTQNNTLRPGQQNTNTNNTRNTHQTHEKQNETPRVARVALDRGADQQIPGSQPEKSERIHRRHHTDNHNHNGQNLPDTPNPKPKAKPTSASTRTSTSTSTTTTTTSASASARPVALETRQSATSSFSHHHRAASPPRTRATTLQSPTATAPLGPSTGPKSKRTASFSNISTAIAADPNINPNPAPTTSQSSLSTATAPAPALVTRRRQTAPIAARSQEALTGFRPELSPTRLQAVVDSTHNPQPAENSTKEWAQGQRELLLPRTLDSGKPDAKRQSRPPISYKAPNIVSAGRAVIPPIRGFRSSGSRKSLGLDMPTRRASGDSYGDDDLDPNQRDRTLRALEGREDDGYSQTSRGESADGTTDNDNTADIFMRIAAEDPSRRPTEERSTAEEPSTISRIARAATHRPFSGPVAPSHQVSTPPDIKRRLSEQRNNSRTGRPTHAISRDHSHRGNTRERPTPIVTIEEAIRTAPLQTTLRPSPVTPRQSTFQDALQDGNKSAYARRRSSVNDSNSGYSANRTHQFRNANLAVGNGRIYNSSPLVPKFGDVIQKHEPQPQPQSQPQLQPQSQAQSQPQPSQASEGAQGTEGTESSNSTAAPSTVWDELDDLKSRINRLELTGKMPSTSGAAMSRASDDRPPTATTNATTMSASPKRGSGNGAAQAEVISTTSSQREAHPILLSALSKTKGLVSPEVFSAIEAAATDAMALSSMVGAPGQPGPISSGASTVGGGGSITDRQLRRKADSICRNLTELCIALADDLGQMKPPQLVVEEEPASPITMNFTGGAPRRRPTLLEESLSPKSNLSPRAPTSLEQRRFTMLAGTTLPSPRFATLPATTVEFSGAGRKSSLLLARTRRAGAEEPEEQAGRKSSLLLRTRRAGTEEPDDYRGGRKTSLLLRTRTQINEEEDESRFRVPSRAITEVNGLRPAPREFSSQTPTSSADNSPLASSALPRRRLVPSSLNPRLVAPSTPTTPMSGRGFHIERPSPEQHETSSMVDKLVEEKSQRQLSLSQTAMFNRTGSLNRRTRDSYIPGFVSSSSQLTPNNTAAAQGTGGYR